MQTLGPIHSPETYQLQNFYKNTTRYLFEPLVHSFWENSGYILFKSSKRLGIINYIFTLWSKVYLKYVYASVFKIQNIWACTFLDYSLTYTIYQFPDLVSVVNIHWVYPLINRVCRWRLQYRHITFSWNTSWCGTLYLICQLKRNKFSKRTVCSEQFKNQSPFKWPNNVTKLTKSVTNFIYQKHLQRKFQLHIMFGNL